MERQFHVGTPEKGIRIDVFLREKLALSRRQVRQLLTDGGVRLDGQALTGQAKGMRLNAASELTITSQDGAIGSVLAEADVPLKVLADGDGFLVVDKPAGVAVHPRRSDELGTVLNSVVGRYPQVQGIGEGGIRSGVVHRLDRDTTGSLLFATTHVRWRKLRAAFLQHRVRKIYRAIVYGLLEGRNREVMNLVVARHRPAKVKVIDAGSKSIIEHDPIRARRGVRRCDLTWRVRETFEQFTLIEICLGTGFLHQIRVMLAHRGNPVYGDTYYGPKVQRGRTNAARQMLHASSIQVDDVHAISPDPDDFASVLRELRRT